MSLPNQIRSTAGAVPVVNEKGINTSIETRIILIRAHHLTPSYQSFYTHNKTIMIGCILIGELSMQKVKVTRYVSGRRPDYAPDDSSGESSAEEEEFGTGGGRGDGGEEGGGVQAVRIETKEDPRLRRLRERRMMVDTGR